MVAAPKSLGVLQGKHVAHVFNHTKGLGVASAVGTDCTNGRIAERVALGAECGLLGEVVDGVGIRLGQSRRDTSPPLGIR